MSEQTRDDGATPAHTLGEERHEHHAHEHAHEDGTAHTHDHAHAGRGHDHEHPHAARKPGFLARLFGAR